MKSWRLKTLGDIGHWGSGGTPNTGNPAYYGGSIAWLVIEDLNDEVVTKSEKTITPLGLEESSAKLLDPNTLLIAMYGSIGKLGITGIPCATNQAIAHCIPDLTQVDLYFLFYFLLNSRADLNSAGKGVAQQNINQGFLKTYPIPLPPLDEQRRIAAILADADHERRRRRFIQRQSDQVLHDIFVRMFGDPATNPMGWEVVTIGDVVAISQYGTSEKSNQKQQGYPVLGMGNITYNGRIDLSSLAYIDLSQKEFEQLRLTSGDVIFNRTNSTELVGKTACWRYSMDAVLASYLVKLQLYPHVIPEYFVALLNTPFFKQLFQERCKKAVGQSNLSPTLLKEFPFMLPRTDLQQSFAEIQANHEITLAQQAESARQADHLFHTLLDQAFKGELS